MKKIIVLIVCFIMSFTAGFVYAKGPLKVFIENTEVNNNYSEYIIKNKKVYVCESALKRDFGFNIFYDENKNKIIIYNIGKELLQEKNKLAQEFIECYSPKNSDEAAELWAKGIQEKNGIFQYAVLDKSLRESLRQEFEKQGDWITKIPSNCEIKNYEIKKQKMNDSNWTYNIVFNGITSANKIFKWHASLLISKEDNKWKIIHIKKEFY